MKVFINANIFTGYSIEKNKTLLTDEGKIIAITSEKNFTGPDVVDVKQQLLVPAFIDLQLYGGNQHLFGEFPSVEALEATYAYCLTGGTTHFLPTIATNSLQVMLQGIEAVKKYWKKGGKGVLGLHLEGPFINEIKRGAHLLEHIRKPTVEEINLLLEKGKGVIKMITLAPEVCSNEVIRILQQAGIVIAAGHSNATYEEALAAFKNGIRVATHLYNAMSPLQHRQPGLTGAILDTGDVATSIVADGFHVNFAAIRIAKKLLSDKLFLITDAVTENQKGHYSHQLNGDKYIMPDGTLSGSSLTMLQAVKNCIQQAFIDTEEALRMASLYPAKVLGLHHHLGKLEKNYAADFLILDSSLQLEAVYSGGQLMAVA
jgi:N-acetylglucosamine-6-phosphate deacetylase